MNPVLTDLQTVARRIAQGESMLVAGSETALRALPKGNWIGGTIPYSPNDPQGLHVEEQIFASGLSAIVKRAEILVHDKDSLRGLYAEAPENGFSIILIPAESATHFSFALNAPTYPEFATRPLAGWIAGVPLDLREHASAKVFDGRSGQAYDDAALVMHAELPPSLYADVGIINVFEQSEGEVISFDQDGFSFTEAFINGRKTSFARYLKEANADLRLPLVADYHGAMVNSSFQSLNDETGEVRMWAPLFRGISYRMAKPIGDYGKVFAARVAELQSSEDSVIFTCNCILNFVFSHTTALPTSLLQGPATAGEVAYQLLNQTMVYITINQR